MLVGAGGFGPSGIPTGAGIGLLSTATNKDRNPMDTRPNSTTAQPHPSMPKRERGDLSESDVSSGAV